jgi:hypothetical protein
MRSGQMVWEGKLQEPARVVQASIRSARIECGIMFEGLD